MTSLFLIQSSLIWWFQSVLANQPDLKISTYKLLKKVHTWYALSNNTVGDDGSATSSLEAIHNGVHLTIGGHMAESAVAGMLFCTADFLGNG